MTSNHIFKDYFKRKLIIWGGIGIAAILIRYLTGHDTSFVYATVAILFFFAAAFVMGYIDYSFYERSAPKIIAKLIDKSPLADFQHIGFSKQDGSRIEGQINNYNVVLSPLTNLQGEKYLTVLIPLEIREGLESYLTKYDDTFKFRFSNGVLFAEALLKDYEKLYDFKKLFTLLDRTTLSLRDKNIEPLNIAGDSFPDESPPKVS